MKQLPPTLRSLFFMMVSNSVFNSERKIVFALKISWLKNKFVTEKYGHTHLIEGACCKLKRVLSFVRYIDKHGRTPLNSNAFIDWLADIGGGFAQNSAPKWPFLPSSLMHLDGFLKYRANVIMGEQLRKNGIFVLFAQNRGSFWRDML